jgi:hypothetical protein
VILAEIHCVLNGSSLHTIRMVAVVCSDFFIGFGHRLRRGRSSCSRNGRGSSRISLCCVLGDVDDGGEVHKEGGGGSDVQWLMISVSFQVGSWVSICLVLEISGLFGDHAMSCAIAVANVAFAGGRNL